MFKNTGLVIIAILALCLIFFNEQILEIAEFGKDDKRPTIAKVKSLEGQVDFKLAGTLAYQKAKSGLELKNFDTLVTNESSQAIVDFTSGFSLEVDENSVLVIEEPENGKDGVIVVTFLQGNFKVLNKGAPGRLVLSKGGKVQDAGGRPAPDKPITITKAVEKPEIEKEEIQALKPIVPKKTKKKGIVEKERESLSDEYISKIIKRQATFFKRCYSEYFKLNPDAKGRINLSFTIDPNGKVSSVRLINSTIPDVKLQQCTMAVVERARFKEFKGEPIVISYPINFE